MAEQIAVAPLSLQGFNQLPARQKLAALALLAFVFALLAAAWMWARTPNYVVLFSNVSDKDGGAIVAALQQQNIPYKFSEGGAAILVPSHQVHDVRLRLASQGLPKGGGVGFELMDGQKLGVSQFLEQLNYQRALEGELTRSIQSLAAVRGARVHLAIPKSSGFLRDEQKPSASVLVNLHPGRRLEPAQVAGVVHLVASSVPQLTTEAVSVIDQDGNLLSVSGDPMRTAGLDASQLKYVQELEQSYVKRIESILLPITGPGNIRAQVTADVDFSHTEQTAESYRPNQGSAEPSVRSQQTSEAVTREPGAAGVPGALTNQPPAPATAPITTPPAPGTPATAASSPGSTAPKAAAPADNAQVNSRREATINYELDKTIRHTRQAVGSVKRLSVAVVVNHRRETAADGNVTATPFSEAEMKQIQDLVKEAMGYNKERGDTLNVANSPFNQAAREAAPETPLWKDPQILELAKDAGKLVLFGALAAWAYLAFVRPMLRALAERASAQPVLPEPEEPIALGVASAGSYDHKLSAARELAKQDPKLIANVIKGWVGGNG